MRRALAFTLCLALAAFEAGAATLYRWTDPDGREAIGTTPPPGVEAELWTPGRAETAAEPPPPAAAAPAAASPASPAETAERERRKRCALAQESARELESALAKREAEVARLEARLGALQASDVAYSRLECRDDGTPGERPCTDQVFDRDAEIARLEAALERAREKLDDLELRTRVAPPAADCS